MVGTRAEIPLWGGKSDGLPALFKTEGENSKKIGNRGLGREDGDGEGGSKGWGFQMQSFGGNGSGRRGTFLMGKIRRRGNNKQQGLGSS